MHFHDAAVSRLFGEDLQGAARRFKHGTCDNEIRVAGVAASRTERSIQFFSGRIAQVGRVITKTHAQSRDVASHAVTSGGNNG